jgi:guanosine-3',5'-bis(diphosphate) 3'-pyrophosphohydrolase
MHKILQQVADFADRAHGDQTRKYSPDRYMVHPIRVMETCSRFTNDQHILAAALLHDVLEDTPVTAKQIKDFLSTVFPEPITGQVLQLVIDLTDVYVKKDFPKMNRRTRKQKELQRLEKTSADSQTIKYADIMDNAVEIVQEDPEFAPVYLKECRTILRKLDKGDPELRRQALQLVNDRLASLDH